MKRILSPWGIFAALGLLLSACSQSGIIGSDLLEGDQISVVFTDEIPFTAYLQTTDSIATYDPDAGATLGGFLCGQFADPVFGLTEAVVNAQIRLESGNPPDFVGAVLDSAVLILPYRANRVYGDTSELFQYEVFLLDEALTDTARYYSNKYFPASQLIGSASLYPRPNDSIEILRHGADTAIVIPAQARIRLDQGFAQSLMMEDSVVLATDTAFTGKYKGLQIKGVSQNKGLMSFNLASSLAGLTFYYHQDTIYRQYTFRFTTLSPRMVSFTHDYTGAPIEAFLQDSTRCDSVMFVQGMSGVGLVIELPDTDILEGKIVNRAELELSVLVAPEDGGYTFNPIQQLIVSQIKEDGSLAVIPDVTIGLLRQELSFIFGGTPQDEMPQRYYLNLSAYFKDLKNGDVTNRILITPLTRAEYANRVVFYGPKHSLYPAKIKLSLTDY